MTSSYLRTTSFARSIGTPFLVSPRAVAYTLSHLDPIVSSIYCIYIYDIYIIFYINYSERYNYI